MPTYEYECKSCDKVFEVFQSITAAKLETCPTCGAPIRRLLGTGGGIVLKGTGWYQTDFKDSGKKSGKPETKAENKTGESAGADKKDAPKSGVPDAAAKPKTTDKS